MKQALLLLVSFFCVVCACPVTGMTEDSALQERTHFIVLIDDSGDMKGHRDKKPRIMFALPRVLFNGVGDIPIINADRDQLSVAFFSLSRTEGGTRESCKTQSDNRLQPEFLFDWKSVTSAELHKDRFARVLNDWLYQTKNGVLCRFQEKLSPIAISQVLILPFAGEKLLQEGDRAGTFTKIIVVTVTNAAYNVLPSAEMTYLASKEQVRDTATAQWQANKVTQYFAFEAPEKWLIAVDNGAPGKLYLGYDGYDEYKKKGPGANPLRLQVTAVRPLAVNVDSLVDVPKEVALDRVAVSSERLDLRMESGGVAALRILPSDRFVPQTAYWQVGDGAGGAWVVAHSEGREEIHRALKEHSGNLCIHFTTIVRTKSGGNRAVSPEFAITGLIFHPCWFKSQLLNK